MYVFRNTVFIRSCNYTIPLLTFNTSVSRLCASLSRPLLLYLTRTLSILCPRSLSCTRAVSI